MAWLDKSVTACSVIDRKWICSVLAPITKFFGSEFSCALGCSCDSFTMNTLFPASSRWFILLWHAAMMLALQPGDSHCVHAWFLVDDDIVVCWCTVSWLLTITRCVVHKLDFFSLLCFADFCTDVQRRGVWERPWRVCDKPFIPLIHVCK